MSMTLKLEYRDWPTAPGPGPEGEPDLDAYPSHTIQAWIADVTQVTKVGAIPPESWEAGSWRDDGPFRFEPDQWEVWCWGGNRPHLFRVGILVLFGNGERRNMLVERAWLLSEAGATIERIAP